MNWGLRDAAGVVLGPEEGNAAADLDEGGEALIEEVAGVGLAEDLLRLDFVRHKSYSKKLVRIYVIE